MFKNSINQEISISDTLNHLIDGVKIAFSKECRAFVIIPIIINIFVMSLGGYFIFSYLNDFIFGLADNWPDFLKFVAYILSTILAIVLGFVGCYFFSTVATIIASPFYGFLSDKVEKMLTGKNANDDTVMDAIKDVPRILKREAQKQIFFLPRALLCLIITIIPGLNVISPILWFLLTAWMACLQYCDYAYDNHKTAIALMRKDLRDNRLSTFIFGMIVSIGISIPIINLILPPAAVCAGTKYYLQIQKSFTLDKE